LTNLKGCTHVRVTIGVFVYSKDKKGTPSNSPSAWRVPTVSLDVSMFNKASAKAFCDGGGAKAKQPVWAADLQDHG
jgi:hypothetical protein